MPKRIRLAFGMAFCLYCFMGGAPALAEYPRLGGSGGAVGDEDRFAPLGAKLPSPNRFRTASGAPGPDYWQQRADYKIDVELDEENHRIVGTAVIDYTNNSPDVLRYLWLHLDANLLTPGSIGTKTETAPNLNLINHDQLRMIFARRKFDGGMTIHYVRDAVGNALPYTIVDTLMRVDLPIPLTSGENTIFSIKWEFEVVHHKDAWARKAYEPFEEGGAIYQIAQWFPRMAAYTDYVGWQTKPFLGWGEFTLEFGDYLVSITVPDDHLVAATGLLMNPDEVLTETQRERLHQAENTDRPVFVVTPEEALEIDQGAPTGKKTWVFHAENVRDFAFASSRRFIWDAWGVNVGGKTVMAMSFYSREGEPLWSRYSTQAVAHTLEVYSRYTFPYPYPVAISVNGPVGGGMEYPMISFNQPRPEADGTYSKEQKYRMISIVIHEVGHNWFPMIVNSDERQWMWMDEGLNTFLQYLAEQEWEEDYPSWAGEPKNIVHYMTSYPQTPIMTGADSAHAIGPNAYHKPATALNVLRETILGRELFDFAFKEYANRWMFKRPTPADFFRSINDSAGMDLDWFWRGWFFTTDHVDVAIENVTHYEMNVGDPEIDKARRRADREAEPRTISQKRNEGIELRVDRYPELLDFYNEFDDLEVTDQDREAYENLLENLDEDEIERLQSEERFYVVDFRNIGGLLTPLIIKVEYESGETEIMSIPAEIWRLNYDSVSKLLLVEEPIQRIVLDPYLQTPDADRSNNVFPQRIETKRFGVSKRTETGTNPMREAGLGQSEEDKDEEEG